MKKYLIGISVVLVGSVSALFAYNQELIEAYAYAYTIGITTMPTIEQADMNGNLIRSHMAKMMSNYATEVLNLVPNTGKVCSFNDIGTETPELQGFIQKACQLGLMGVGIENFNPQGIVTRAEFGTVLSRAIWRETYNLTTNPYYTAHLQALKDAGIMTMISNPNQWEVRGYVMLMMQRADDILHTGNTVLPTAQVVYSTTGSTTGNVTATLTGRNKTITGVNTYTHLFIENGSFIFYFQDLSGNLGTVTATVNNIIDRSKPIASVKYSTTGATNSDVVATLTGRNETLTGANTYTHTFTGNGSFTFTFSDLAGNTGSILATVDNIDKIAPTAIVNLSPLSGAYTSGNIIATLTGYSENLMITNNSGLNTYTFSGTGQNFTFNFVDAAGNTGSTLATTAGY